MSGVPRTVSSSASLNSISFTTPFNTISMSPCNSPSLSSSSSRGFPTTTVAELVNSEAHYLSTLKRVGNALNLASNYSVAAGRKTSNTVRSLVERWTAMMQIHIKFHDDIIAAKEDIRSTTTLLESLLLTLEPVLVDHGRDLSSAVYKLNRYDKKSKQKSVDWDVALRHPFDQLTVYTEWLQRIDPQGHISAECLSQLNGLVHNIQAVTEVNQNPRGMLKRISTLARGVLRRQSSSPLLIGPPSSESSSYSPLTPSTAISRASTEFSTGDSGRLKQSSNATPRASMDVSRPHSAGTTVTAMTASDNRIETVTDAHAVSGSMHRISSSALATKSANSSSASASMMSITSRSVSGTMGGQSNRDSVVCSEAGGSSCSSNSVGSLTLAPSMETLHVKIVTTTITATASPPPAVITTTRPTIPGRQLSLPTERKKFLDDDRERETRRATLRVGTQALITATAESLQSPTFVSRPSIDRLRTITKRETATKPAVKSLISFWEQTSSELVEA